MIPGLAYLMNRRVGSLPTLILTLHMDLSASFSASSPHGSVFPGVVDRIDTYDFSRADHVHDFRCKSGKRNYARHHIRQRDVVQ